MTTATSQRPVVMNASIESALRVFMAFATIAALCLLFLKAWTSSADTDVFWQLATGRETLANGFPRTNVFTDPALGYGIICQQWLWCVISWALYDTSGWTALRTMCVAECVVACALVYALARVQSRNADATWHGLAVAVAAIALMPHATWRPHLVTVILALCSIIALERWRHGGDNVLLCIPVAVSALHANMHGALAPLQPTLLALYLLPLPWRGEDGKLPARRRRPQLAAALVAAIAVLGLTPYGFESALVGVDGLVSMPWLVGMSIQELRPLVLCGSEFMGALYICESAVCVLPAVHKMLSWRRIPREAYGYDGVTVVMVAASCVYVMLHARMMMMFSIAAPFAVARLASDATTVAKHSRSVRRLTFSGAIAALAAAAIVAGFSAAGVCSSLVTTTMDGERSLAEALASGDHDEARAYDAVIAAGADPSTDLVFTTFDSGGYGEFLGFKVTLDARTELWLGRHSGYEDPLLAEVDGMFGDETRLDWLVRRVRWDYAVVVNVTPKDGLPFNSLLARRIDDLGATRIYESDDGDVVAWRAPEPWPTDAVIESMPPGE